MKPYIFLDRDGTINVEKNYLYKISDFEFEDGAVDALKLLQQKGYHFVIISNQSGIAKGYYTLQDANILNDYMCALLAKQGIIIDKVYICPHDSKDKCECRKPGIKLFQEAIKEFGIDVKKSYCVGDRIRDIEPAQGIGAKKAFLLTGHGPEDINKIKNRSIVYKNLLDFAERVERAE